ncbi:MAG: hypothetical protein KHZ87_00600 [Clostridiales bacterium]|nr:hypothetical protein [Clostridiales bacterium]MBS5877645.1 hypothetical protein [Clostridiales bacterium]MDU0939468.1 hypothetical protein [Clostridiales bacterium]MDU1042000.1 hypothetical protein [Clostridiales bacterium]
MSFQKYKQEEGSLSQDAERSSLFLSKNGARELGMKIFVYNLREFDEKGRIGFAGLDVVENEIGMYYYDHVDEILKNRYISVINAMPNAHVFPHMGVCTDVAVRDMVVNSLLKAKDFFEVREK